MLGRYLMTQTGLEVGSGHSPGPFQRGVTMLVIPKNLSCVSAAAHLILEGIRVLTDLLFAVVVSLLQSNPLSPLIRAEPGTGLYIQYVLSKGTAHVGLGIPSFFVFAADKLHLLASAHARPLPDVV
jgi:hypothetical protein